MTIRRNIDASALNEQYMAFEEACTYAPEGTYELAKSIWMEVGAACDELIRRIGAIDGAAISNSDGIREIEVMIFDAIRRESKSFEIESAIGLGTALRYPPEFGNNDRTSILHRVERDGKFLASREEWEALGIIKDEPEIDDSEERFGLEPILGNTDY